MKAIALWLVCICSHSVNAGPPSELAAMRARYDASIVAATNPITERYIKDLQQLKSRAMAQKDLEFAVAVDAELDKVSAPAQPAAIKTASDLARFLEGTHWTWGMDVKSAQSKLQFLRDGACIINNDPPTRWTAEDANTVVLSVGAKIRFSSDYYRYEGKTSSGAARAGKRLRLRE